MSALQTGIGLALLAAITFGVTSTLRLERTWLQPWAILRAALQLGVLSLALHGIITNTWWVAAFLVVMVGAATWVVFRRLNLPAWRAPQLAGLLAGSAAIPVVAVFAVGAVEFSARYVLAVGGIVVGGAMTVATLMGRTLNTSLVDHRDEVEGWLALGATPRIAAHRVVRDAGSISLIPATDQTRATGIVTLPGAFVGAVFAGASPLEAAQFQLLVLGAMLAAGALTVAGMSVAFGAPTTIATRQ